MHSRWSLIIQFSVFSACACSFFVPSVDEYASGSLGAQGGASNGGASGPAGGSAGTAGVQAVGGNGGVNEAGANQAGANQAAGTGGGTSGASAEAGAAGEVELPPALQGSPVAAASLTLKQVITIGVPVFAPLTGYSIDEATAALPGRQNPLYAPYDASSDAWWDELVAEQLQARVPNVLFPTRGAYTTLPADLTGPGNENPRRLLSWVQALQRADAVDLFHASCRVESDSFQAISNMLHGAAATTPFDFSSKADWDSVVWQRVIAPWFDTLPSSYWSKNPVIQFGGVSAAWATNMQGNASGLISHVATAFNTAYAIVPLIILDQSWFSADTTLANNASVNGSLPSYGLPDISSGFARYGNYDNGVVLPGLIDPSYFQATSSNYHKASAQIARSSLDAYGNQVFTLETGLAAAFEQPIWPFTVVFSWDDVSDSTGLYRSLAWDYPNEYLDLFRRYSDPPTRTVRLEAEGCDAYKDLTPGNSGGAFRRSGDLDVRALSGGSGWAVTDTSVGEWIEWVALDLANGDYDFSVRYATAASKDVPELELAVDGKNFPPILLPQTTNSDTFALTSLGQETLDQGAHTLRVRFLGGHVDLDWLFVRKADPAFSLQVAAGTYVSVLAGGGSTINAAVQVSDAYESLTFEDRNGGALEDGDQVTLQTYNGYYINAPTATTLGASQRAPDKSSVFTVKSLDTGAIADGKHIALLNSDGVHYWTATGKALDASGTTLGAAQTFFVHDDVQN